MTDLNIAYEELRARIGDWLGYGRGSVFDSSLGDPSWSKPQLARIGDGVKAGLSKFYWPFIEAFESTYTWTFLTPAVSLTIKSGNRFLDLPDDFAYVVGDVYQGDSASVPKVLHRTGVGWIEQRYAIVSNSTGPPETCAILAQKMTDGQKVPRYQLYVYPEPNADFQIRLQYAINPVFLSGRMPVAYGGPMHAQTLLAACLATVELDLDGKIQEREADFQKKLLTSVKMDRENQAEFLGYNADANLRKRHGHYWRQTRFPTITIGGVTPQ